MSSLLMVPRILERWLLTPVKSPLPIFLNACCIVSTFSSPPKSVLNLGEWGLCGIGSGLPARRAPNTGEASSPLTEVEILVDGELPYPCDDVGERIGDGDNSCGTAGE